MSESCPKCGSPTLSWFTSREGLQAADVQQCSNCGVRVCYEDWTPPLTPLGDESCMNCSGNRSDGSCRICGLTSTEDAQVHEELRELIDKDMSFLNAAKAAGKSGRRLLALKLATAGSRDSDQEQANTSRALRIWLLAAIGFSESALSDAKLWLSGFATPPAIAWATLGQQLENADRRPDALDAYGRALAIDSSQTVLYASRAKIMLSLRMLDEAKAELLSLYQAPQAVNAARIAGLDIAWGVCDAYLRANQPEPIQSLVDAVETVIEANPGMLAHRAHLLATSGQAKAAKRDLKRARKLHPNLPLYELVERALKSSSRSTWWRW